MRYLPPKYPDPRPDQKKGVAHRRYLRDRFVFFQDHLEVTERLADKWENADRISKEQAEALEDYRTRDIPYLRRQVIQAEQALDKAVMRRV